MKYDVITDHYAAALHIAEKPHYAIKLNLYDLTECISVIEKQVSRLKSEDLKLAYFNNLPADSIQTAAIKTLEKARGIIQDEIEKRGTSEQVPKERTERNKKERPIQAIDVIRFYRYFGNLFPNEEPGKVPDMERRKKWARRHGYNAGTIRNAETELIKLKEKEPEADAKCWAYIEKIGPEKVAYIVNQITEPEHEKAKYKIIHFIEMYRDDHQKRGP
jgi:hypothetical protein